MATSNDNLSKESVMRMAFDAWKFQVETYWTRSSYFVVFELACAAGIWKIFDAKHWWTSGLMSLGALALTLVWILNNARLSEYINYYWRQLKHLERTFHLEDEDCVFSMLEMKRQRKRYPGNYRQYVGIIPWVFAPGWLWMLGWSVVSLYMRCACTGLRH